MKTTCFDILAINETRPYMILYLVAKLQYQAMPWSEMKKDRGGVGINYERSFVLDCKSLEWIGIIRELNLRLILFLARVRTP